MFGMKGLKGVKTKDLKLILRAIHRGELSCPITPIGLATTGLLRLQDDLGILSGLNDKATSAVLVAVIAERPREPQPE